ncbi:MAG: hypothetical protein WBP85_04130 [Terracidiphilus sp.]
MNTSPNVEVLGIQGLIEKAREGETFLDISSPLPYALGIVTQAYLIAELETKVKHYRERVEEYRSKLRVWESALKSALEEKGENSKASGKSAPQQVKGKVSRAFVREVLKHNAKSGVTPKQIREAAEQQGLTYPNNFPHTTLHKFRTQARPEVRQEGGKYFPVSPEQ